MRKNLDLALKLFRQGTVLLIHNIRFSNGVVKSKYVILLEDAEKLYETGRVMACLTTSRQYPKLYAWQVLASADILGKNETDVTTIDCRNRIEIKEFHFIRCRFVGFLKEYTWQDVQRAYEAAKIYEVANPPR